MLAFLEGAFGESLPTAALSSSSSDSDASGRYLSPAGPSQACAADVRVVLSSAEAGVAS